MPTPQCGMTQYDGSSGSDVYFPCNRPARAYIVDNRRGKVYLCGIHRRAYDRTSERAHRPPSREL
jgi:hypothetical protein